MVYAKFKVWLKYLVWATLVRICRNIVPIIQMTASYVETFSESPVREHIERVESL